MSTRAYPAPARPRTTSSNATSSFARRRTGSRSETPFTSGWSSARIGATTTLSSCPSSGCAMRRSTATRVPTMSAPGDRRSCGSVSQDGNSATQSRGNIEESAATRSSASRFVAVTKMTSRSSANVAASSGCIVVGATMRSSSARFVVSAAKTGSWRSTETRFCSVTSTPSSMRPSKPARNADCPICSADRVFLPAYARDTATRTGQ